MVEAKGWGNLCRKEVREGFARGLLRDIENLRGDPIIWGNG